MSWTRLDTVTGKRWRINEWNVVDIVWNGLSDEHDVFVFVLAGFATMKFVGHRGALIFLQHI
jgi:hypothetical protein